MKNIKKIIFFQVLFTMLVSSLCQAQMIDYSRIEKRRARKIHLIKQAPAVNQAKPIVEQKVIQKKVASVETSVKVPAESLTEAQVKVPAKDSVEMPIKKSIEEPVVQEKIRIPEVKRMSKAEFQELIKSNPKVQDRIERIYDLNRDGILQRDEIIDMYKDVVLSVNRRGSFLVSSDLLKEFDQNNDGQISRAEATNIKETIN